jgi:hypothetical protein
MRQLGYRSIFSVVFPGNTSKDRRRETEVAADTTFEWRLPRLSLQPLFSLRRISEGGIELDLILCVLLNSLFLSWNPTLTTGQPEWRSLPEQ